MATLFAFRLRGDDAFGTLLSSKVNQWTLLVGSLPLAYLLGGGGGALHLDARQTEEFLLTAAQALLGLAVLLNLKFDRREAAALLVLFALQFPFPHTAVRVGFSVVYLVAAIVIGLVHRRALVPTLTWVVRSPRTDPGNRAAPLALRCPRDRTTLLTSESQGVEIDYCPDCRGAWVDGDELEAIVERAATGRSD